MRRTYISELLDAGADLARLQKMVGHESVTTTAGYDRHGDAAKRKAADLVHVPFFPLSVIAAIQLGNFMDLLMSTPENRANGWTEEVLEIGARLKKDYPGLQFKVKARIRHLLLN